MEKFMDRIDALGDRPDRHTAYTKELLAEAEDQELQKIVEKASKKLSTPIALVNLVLDQIQFFKASVGLPPDLAAAKSTHRDVSFCQFVVRDNKEFKVTDACRDERVPQHLVDNYNIRAYLGVPLEIGEVTIGSLCVIDTKEREFSDEDEKNLRDLGILVNKRLREITNQRRQTRLDLAERAFQPGITELTEALIPIQHSISSGYAAVATIRSFLNLTEHLLETQPDLPEAFRYGFEAAQKAVDLNEELLYDIEASFADCGDCIHALEKLTVSKGSLTMSDVVIAAQDLSRHATKKIGGFPLPDFESDAFIYTNGTLAIAIVTNFLLSIASVLIEKESVGGIRMEVIETAEFSELIYSSPDLNENELEFISGRYIDQLREEPSVTIKLDGDQLKLAFKIQKSAAFN